MWGGEGHTWSNFIPWLYPQEQNSELQAKYQKLLVRSPGGWGVGVGEDRGGGLMGWGLRTP